jgi:hypothetical protein
LSLLGASRASVSITLKELDTPKAFRPIMIDEESYTLNLCEDLNGGYEY